MVNTVNIKLARNDNLPDNGVLDVPVVFHVLGFEVFNCTLHKSTQSVSLEVVFTGPPEQEEARMARVAAALGQDSIEVKSTSKSRAYAP